MHHVRMHRATRPSTCALVPQPSNARGEPGTRLKKLDATAFRCPGAMQRKVGGGRRGDRGGGIKYHDSVLQWGVGRIEGGGRKIKYHDRVRVWAAVIMPSRI